MRKVIYFIPTVMSIDVTVRWLIPCSMLRRIVFFLENSVHALQNQSNPKMVTNIVLGVINYTIKNFVCVLFVLKYNSL